MADAEVYQKTAQDKVAILNVRGVLLQPFVAPNWVDLRVGFFLSLTSALSDDIPPTTDLTETIVNSGSGLTSDHYSLGLIGSSGSPFIGFTNLIYAAPNQVGNYTLVSSDNALGTTPANFWRPGNTADNTLSFAIYDTFVLRARSPDGLQQHFVRDPAGAGGYAVLLGFQVLRDNAQSRTVRVNIKSSGHSADMLYTNTPTLDVLRQALGTWPPGRQMGPVTLSALPDNLQFYWPFRNSRLRIHAYGVVKAK